MNRLTKILFMLAIAIWGLVGGIANLLAYQDGYNSVAFAFSMVGAEGAPAMWRAIESPLLIHLGFAFIWGSKLATGALCSCSTARLWTARNAARQEFNQAKRLGITGASISMLMLFFGFMVVSGTYFELWRDVETMGYEAHVYAFIYFGFIGLSTLFISLDEASTNQE